jgi:hypothetical protein
MIAETSERHKRIVASTQVCAKEAVCRIQASRRPDSTQVEDLIATCYTSADFKRRRRFSGQADATVALAQVASDMLMVTLVDARLERAAAARLAPRRIFPTTRKDESIEAPVPCGRRSAGSAVAIAVAIGQFPQRIQGPT